MGPRRSAIGILLVTAALGFFLDSRIGSAGDWLPPVPHAVGIWRSVDQSDAGTLLGHPRYLSRVYFNALGEQVRVFAVAADSADTYHDPRGCHRGVGYEVTAEERRHFEGPNTPVRVMVLRNRDSRLVMYYWLQDKDGATSADGPLYHDVFARVGMMGKLAADAVNYLRRVRTMPEICAHMATGRRTCIVRVYAEVGWNDPYGGQALRNVDEISRLVYRSLRDGGDHGRRGGSVSQ